MDSQMIPIQKLRQNLVESDKWRTAFRQQIKKCLSDISNKNEQIIATAKGNDNLKNQIQKQRCELKRSSDESQKVDYKTAKMMIQIEQLQARIKMYHQSLAKKEDYNRVLTNKVLGFEVDIEREKSLLYEYATDETSDSNPSDDSRSVSSRISEGGISFKSASLKKVFGAPRTKINQKLDKVKKMEYQHITLMEKNRKKEEELQRIKKIGQRLRQKLGAFQHELNSRLRVLEQSIGNDAYTQSIDLKLSQFSFKNDSLNKDIQFQQQFIQNVFESMNCILLCDGISEDIRKQTVILEREARRQKCTMATIGTYLAKQAHL